MEQQPSNLGVGGSNPSERADKVKGLTRPMSLKIQPKRQPRDIADALLAADSNDARMTRLGRGLRSARDEVLGQP
jgi:hypothetical protein